MGADYAALLCGTFDEPGRSARSGPLEPLWDFLDCRMDEAVRSNTLDIGVEATLQAADEYRRWRAVPDAAVPAVYRALFECRGFLTQAKAVERMAAAWRARFPEPSDRCGCADDAEVLGGFAAFLRRRPGHQLIRTAMAQRDVETYMGYKL